MIFKHITTLEIIYSMIIICAMGFIVSWIITTNAKEGAEIAGLTAIIYGVIVFGLEHYHTTKKLKETTGS